MKRRVNIKIEGIVQGVGFRPFVAQQASSLALSGWVLNDGRGVVIEAQGSKGGIEHFLLALRNELPPLARLERCEVVDIPLGEEGGFAIRESVNEGCKTATVAPDAHVCDDCLAELFSPTDRRYRYPFINCTNCGPRFSLITGIPYDRPNTTMADFGMCGACRTEYEAPASRRHHAQPIACPECGPQLTLHNCDGEVVAGDPLARVIEALHAGKIVAIKGLGGYHLAVAATDEEAVSRLRQRKARDEKPLALMVATLDAAQRITMVGEKEARLLSGSERPIVLLEQRPGHGLASGIAPRNRFFGVMLAYTPLHHLLLAEGGFPALVMTSGNRSDEPIAFDDADARDRLRGIADLFLLHDRRIHIRIDDSITRVLAGDSLVLRRARGYVPRPLMLPVSVPQVLALGGELKNTLCFTRGERAYLSQHLGDLANVESFDAHAAMMDHFKTVLDLSPQIVAHDLHPDYHTTRVAEGMEGVRRVAVQHHHAHLVSCLAENRFGGPAIGVIFDGLGYGLDGRIWGGEFLVGDLSNFRRVGHFDWMPMPGGDAATREPWRMALACLYKAYGCSYPLLPFLDNIAESDRKLVVAMIDRGLNAPLTSSCGRLFDSVAALIGIRNRVAYEGQAALELEMIADPGERATYPFELFGREEMWVLDSQPMIRAIVSDMNAGLAPQRISARFHRTLAQMVLIVCERIREEERISCVALSGGVFQNRLLTEQTIELLRRCSFDVLTHSLVPPNDGGLSLGQAVVAGMNCTAA